MSVILPTYNRLSRLKECLPTFLRTKLQDVEFIIVDNCSTDGTWSYLMELASSDKRIRILQNPQNVGAVKSILRCYCEVKSPFALFLADDDKLEGDYIQLCYNIFIKHENVGMIHHFASGWKNNVVDQKDDYIIHKAGEGAQMAISLISGSYPGIAFRMNNFDLESFSLDEGAIYPQVKASFQVSKDYDLAIIKKCGIVSPDWNESIVKLYDDQKRPTDFGLNERIFYINKYTSRKVLFSFVYQTFPWLADQTIRFKNESKSSPLKILFSVSKYYFNLFSLMHLIMRREYKFTAYYLLVLLVRPVCVLNFITFSIEIAYFKKIQ